MDNQTLLADILAAIESDDLELPVLPDVALRIRDLIDDPNVSADKVVRAISNDPAITSQIIKVANSAAFIGKPLVENVRDAISRIGYRMLRNVVMSLTVGSMFKSNVPYLNSKLKQVWLHSQEVAAISYVVAQRQKNLKPDQAMLAGLIHNIGMLPICLYFGKNNILISNDEMEDLIRFSHVKIGTILLKSWNFPHDLIDCVAGHEDIHRNSGSTVLADYTDCVLVANLIARGVAKITAWENVSALNRLGLSKEECQFFMEKFRDQITFSRSLLGLAVTKAVAHKKEFVPSPPQLPSQEKPKDSEKQNLFGFISRFFK
jgi:HD-like signal output (HDOD) protein